MTRKERYRTDNEYRLRVLAEVKKNQEINKKNPTWRRLVKCRKQIYSLRESINNHLHKVELLERRVFAHLKRKEILEREYKLSKANVNRGTTRVYRDPVH